MRCSSSYIYGAFVYIYICNLLPGYSRTILRWEGVFKMYENFAFDACPSNILGLTFFGTFKFWVISVRLLQLCLSLNLNEDTIHPR